MHGNYTTAHVELCETRAGDVEHAQSVIIDRNPLNTSEFSRTASLASDSSQEPAVLIEHPDMAFVRLSDEYIAVASNSYSPNSGQCMVFAIDCADAPMARRAMLVKAAKPNGCRR
jgi:hypothetical protein